MICSATTPQLVKITLLFTILYACARMCARMGILVANQTGMRWSDILATCPSHSSICLITFTDTVSISPQRSLISCDVNLSAETIAASLLLFVYNDCGRHPASSDVCKGESNYLLHKRGQIAHKKHYTRSVWCRIRGYDLEILLALAP